MNYTRGLYFKHLCDAAANNSNNSKFIAEIDYQIFQIQKRTNGFWGIAHGDITFISYMRKLHKLIKNKAMKKDFDELANDAYLHTEKKLKATIITHEAICWPSLESLYYALASDDRFETKVVFVPFEHKNAAPIDDYQFYIDNKIPVIHYNEFNIANESPDVVIYVKPYKNNIPIQYYITEIERVVPRTVFISYGMETNLDLVHTGYQYYLHYRAWRFCAYGNIVKKYGEKYGFCAGKNIVVWGHPKADHYRNIEDKRSLIPTTWREKINGRKVILWTPHHILDPNNPHGTSTWFQWKDTIFSYFENIDDMVLLWRPHPHMFGALVNDGYMSQKDLNNFINEKALHNNIIVDNTPDYRNSFYASDAAICDGTAFSIEYLYTRKPMLLTPRNIKNHYLYEHLNESCYVAYKEDDIIDFLKMQQMGSDPMKESREKFIKEFLYVPENVTVGENIINNVFNDITKEEIARAKI